MILVYPKSSTELSWIRWIIVSYIAAWGYCATGCAVFGFFHIPVNLTSMGILCLLAAAFLYLYIHLKRKKMQIFYFDRYDFTVLFILTILFLFVFANTYTFQLRPRYSNVDPAVHFKYAMAIVRSEQISGMYFVPLHNATIINIFKPFLAELSYYKAYIISDAWTTLLGISMFYVLVSEYAVSRYMKKAVFILTLFYSASYPLYVYIEGGYIHWSVGVMTISYIIFILKFYLNSIEDKTRLVMTYLMVGTVMCILSYMLFAPVIFIATFCCLTIIRLKRNRSIGMRFIGECVFVFLPACTIGMYYCFFGFFGISESGNAVSNVNAATQKIGNALTLMGGSYCSLWSDFTFLIPIVVYCIIKWYKNRKIDIELLFLVCLVTCTLIMLTGLYYYMISSYYYYKMYYPIWLIVWLLVARFIKYMESNKERTLFYSYIATVLILFVITVFGFDKKITDRNPYIDASHNTDAYFPIYQYNAEWLRKDYGEFEISQDELNAFQYVIQMKKGQEINIPIITSYDKRSYCYWYEGLTGCYGGDYYGWELTYNQFMDKLEKSGDSLFLIQKESNLYTENIDRFSAVKKVFENEKCIIAEK